MTDHPAEWTNKPEMTLAAWAEMGEDEPGELVDGRLVEDEDVGALHDAVAAWFVWVLKSWLTARRGIVLVSDTRFGCRPGADASPTCRSISPAASRRRRGS